MDSQNFALNKNFQGKCFKVMENQQKFIAHVAT